MHSFSRYSYHMVIGVVLLAAALGAALWYHARASQLPTDTMVVHTGGASPSVVVSGTVQAAQDVDLGFAQSGRVSHVYVAVGDTVKAGALLAEVDNDTVRASLAQAQATLESAQADLASLKSGTRPEQIAVTQAQIAGDESALAQAQQSVINALQSAYTTASDAILNKTDVIFTNAQSLSPQLAFPTSNNQLESSVESDRVALAQTLSAWKTAVASLSSASDITSSANGAQSDLAAVSSYLSEVNATLNAAVPSSQAPQATLTSDTSNTALARTNVNAAQAALTSALAAAQAAQSALARDEKTLALEQAGATADDIASQQARVAAARAALSSVQAQLAQTQVTAPFDGTVTRMDAKVGAVVSPNDPQISMIGNGLFQIVSYIPEVEIAGIAIGESASTTLDAYGASVVFPATVIAIDPGNTMVNGVSTYKTTLQFAVDDPRIRSGMTASSEIASQSATSTIAVPQGAVFSKNSTTVVQTIRSGALVDVPVVLGTLPTVGDVQVLSGLSDGDTIVLSPDTSR